LKESLSKLSFEDIEECLSRSIEESERNQTLIQRQKHAWKSRIIDALMVFVEKQQTTNYFFTGMCLEAATKTYALKIDSLYEDVTKLAVILGRYGWLLIIEVLPAT
jgi:hypothetical protein